MISTAGIIIIGDEILSGRTKDLNGNWIAQELSEIGIRVIEIKIILDDKLTIIETVNDYRKKFSYIFTCGGIGPTHDDITTDAVASAFNLKLEKNQEAMRRLREHYKNSKIEFNESRQKMAIIPVGAKLIDNAVSAAPGFNLENLYVFAGVPKIMQSMFFSIKDKLVGGNILISQTISCNIGEGKIANSLEKIENKYKDLKIGSYPYFNPRGFGTSIVLRSENKKIIENASDEIIIEIKKLGGEGKIIY